MREPAEVRGMSAHPRPAHLHLRRHKARTLRERPLQYRRLTDEFELFLRSPLLTLSALGCLPVHFRDVDTFLGHFIQRGQLTQFGYHLHHLVDDVVDFLLRVETAEAKADRRMSQVFADP